MNRRCIAGIVVALTFGFTIAGYAQEIDLSMLLEHHQAPMFLQSSGQTYLLGVTGEQRDGKPPLSVKRIAGEFLYGGAGSAAGIFLGVCIPHLIMKPAEDDDEALETEENIQEIAALVGWVLGSAAGVYVVGDTGNETGSFIATMCGAIAGGGVGIGYAAIDAAIESHAVIETIGLVFLLAPTIGAVVGCNLTRRYDSPPAGSETALINYGDGKTSLAVPRVYFRTDSFGKGNLTQRVDLLRVRF